MATMVATNEKESVGPFERKKVGRDKLQSHPISKGHGEYHRCGYRFALDSLPNCPSCDGTLKVPEHVFSNQTRLMEERKSLEMVVPNNLTEEILVCQNNWNSVSHMV